MPQIRIRKSDLDVLKENVVKLKKPAKRRKKEQRVWQSIYFTTSGETQTLCKTAIVLNPYTWYFLFLLKSGETNVFYIAEYYRAGKLHKLCYYLIWRLAFLRTLGPSQVSSNHMRGDTPSMAQEHRCLFHCLKISTFSNLRPSVSLEAYTVSAFLNGWRVHE